jgi:PAS domain S-box-containing protein
MVMGTKNLNITLPAWSSVHRKNHIARHRKIASNLSEIYKTNFQIINSVSEGIVVFDTNLICKIWNPFMQRITGINKEKVIGQHLSEDFPFMIEPGLLLKLEKTLNGDVQDFNDFYFHIPTTGKSGWISASCIPLRNSSGSIIGVISTVLDINQRKNTELELTKSREKALESDRLKTEFLKNMSHELRTPLNAIVGFADLIACSGQPEDKRKAYSEIISLSSEKLIRIISDIIEISQIEAKQATLRLSEFDVLSLVSNIIIELGEEAKSKNLKYTFTSFLPTNNYFITSDSEKIKWIFLHLLENAIKFTLKGEITVEFFQENSNLIFKITDTGIGISSDAQKYVFEPFRQEETGLTRNFGGNGLGLTIAKSYTELLGGKIELTSKPNRGTSVSVSLPLASASSKTALQGQNSVKRSNHTILIAEDEFSNYLYLHELIKKSRINVLHAKNGLEAVDLCRNNLAIDLVLMDIRLPVMDGSTAAKLIKTIRPELQIIAQTAYPIDYENPDNTNLFDGYLTKPIIKDDFKQKLKEFIDSEL